MEKRAFRLPGFLALVLLLAAMAALVWWGFAGAGLTSDQREMRVAIGSVQRACSWCW
jgi:hypothetical protein